MSGLLREVHRVRGVKEINATRFNVTKFNAMRFIRLILVAAAALACHAATYYVDSAKGADANSGTQERAPWKTLGKVNTARFQPGDRILLKSGSSWQEQLAPASSGG